MNFLTKLFNKEKKANETRLIQFSLRTLSSDRIGIPYLWQNVKVKQRPLNELRERVIHAEYFECSVSTENYFSLIGYYGYSIEENLIFFLPSEIGEDVSKNVSLKTPTSQGGLYQVNHRVNLSQIVMGQQLDFVDFILLKEPRGLPRWTIDQYWIGEVEFEQRIFAVVFQHYGSVYYKEINTDIKWRVFNKEHELFRIKNNCYKVNTDFLKGVIKFQPI